MRLSFPRSLFALVAAPALLLVSSSALASSPCASACNFVTDPSDCTVAVTGGCTAECTPLSLVAECDGMCDGAADVSCTGSCGTSCTADCMANPGSFSCSGECQTNCNGSCESSCSSSSDGTACMTDCQADCTNRCAVQCDAVPPSASCDVSCQASCQGSCKVQANIDCHASCTVSAQGGCTAACSEPNLVAFCDGQYVSESEAASCYSCLLSNGFSVTATETCNASGCNAAAGVCSVGSAVGSSKDGWGVFGVTGLMVGLGLLVSRRSRRGTPKGGSPNPSDRS